MDYRKLDELPAWVKLVNKIIHGNLTLEDLTPAVEAAE
jgi:hypothetical protein